MVKRAATIRQNDKKERTKRIKYDQNTVPAQGKFLNVEDIRESLRSHDTGVLAQALTTLRNQLTITWDEGIPGPQDERLLLAKGWLERAPGAQDVFAILDKVDKPAPNIQSLCLSVIACLLDLFSIHFIYHSIGEAIVKTLLLPHHVRQLNANLGEASTDLITLSTLRVFNSMSVYAGGVEKRSVFDNFAWGQKSLQRLFSRRRKTNKSTQDGTGKSRPDIRTLFINFILSFLSASCPTPLKVSLLEQHRDVFLMIFKGISQDSYLVVRHILEVCWEGIWCDNKMKRTLKVGIFNERTLNHLLKVYDRALPEDGVDDHIPADVVHHFMLALMTHPGVGICFKDRGWYPRDNLLEEDASNTSGMALEDGTFGKNQGGRIYNKILANIIKGLKVNEDPRQQELTFKILEACPELVAGYWGAVNLTLEPRLASRWITNMSVLGTIISIPIPTSSFLLPHSQHHDPSPPPLNSILGNVLPSVLSKTHLTKGLQSSSILVQHCTALAISKCLVKFNQVIRVFRDAADQLQEDRERGLWLKRTREIETEIERRVPDFMVIIAMVQQKQAQPDEPIPVKAALISESALRLLWLYHKLFPRLVSEVKFDVGKLLLNVFNPFANAADEGSTETDEMLREGNHNGLDVMRQMHVLRLLKESDQFSWLNKSGSSPHSYLYSILSLHTKTREASVRQATANLIKSVLSSSIVFSHDIREIDLWLSALPTTRRRTDAKAPDGSPLTDEVAGVLAFLDDCLQRCSKTPYRYLEDASNFFIEDDTSGSSHLPSNDPSAFPSPLLMTVVEQLRAKIGANLLTPSDTLAISTFIRKLTISLVSKMQDLNHLRKLHSRLNEILSSPLVVPNSIIMRNAIQREAVLLSNSLCFLKDPSPEAPLATTHPAVQTFLKDAEGLSIPSSETAASNAAYELVDWIRLVDMPLHHTEAKRLFGTILRLWPAALTEFFYQLDPLQGHLWLTVEDHLEIVEKYLPFEWAHLHSTSVQILQKSVQGTLVDLFFSLKSWSSSLVHRVSIGTHRLTASQNPCQKWKSLRKAELSLFASIIQSDRLDRKASDFTQLKNKMFLECEPIREICCSWDLDNSETEELTKFVNTVVDARSKADQDFVRVYCDYWAAQSQGSTSFEPCVRSLPWIPFMSSAGLIKQLHTAISVSEHHRINNAEERTLKLIIETLTLRSTDIQVMMKLQETVKGLMTVRHSLTNTISLDQLILPVVETGQPLGLNGLTLLFEASENISTITESAQVQWSNRCINVSLDPALLIALLQSNSWNETISKIISGLLYRSPDARDVFQTWISAVPAPDLLLLENAIVPLHAFFDVMTLQTQSQVIQLTDAWLFILIDCLSRAESRSTIRILCASLIKKILQVSSSDHNRCASCIKTEINAGNGSFLNSEAIYLFGDLHRLYGSTFSDVLALFLDEALKWMVRACAGDEFSLEELTVVEALTSVVPLIEPKAHLIEPLMKAAIQNCLHIPEILKCLASLISSTKLKPVVVNRYIQNIVQQQYVITAADAASRTREPFIRLLHTLFHTHPINTCQPSHITLLTQLYGGTLSLSDQLLLTVFHLYERVRKESAASIFCTWSTSASGSVSPDTVKAIISLDAPKVFRTCTMFPARRSSDGSVINEPFASGGDLYDPLCLILLCGQFLVQKSTVSSITWVQVFRSNIFSLLICALTSRDENFRKVAVTTLGGVFRRVQDAEFVERNQVIYVLNMLRDLLPSEPSTAPIPRLSTYPTILLAHALRSIFYPSSFLYPAVSCFLLQRPELDTTDVPMLYSLLYSSDDGEWMKERTWMIRFLTEAMHDSGAADWAILKRRHTWDLIASMWQAARHDERQLRRGILEFLANLSSNPHSAPSLVFRSSTILWIEMQLQTKMANDEEYVAWTKILENFIITVDGNKAHKVTRGDYNLSIGRCLQLILYSVNNSNPINAVNTVSKLELLQLISRVVLRLANKAFGSQEIIADIIHNTTDALQRFESSISWSNTTELCRSVAYPVPQGPHRARSLFELFTLKDDAQNNKRFALQAWAETLVTLWQAAMTLEGSRKQSDVNTWDVLTCRLLILRGSPWFNSTVQNEQMQLVEWVRKETVICFLNRQAML